MKIKAPTILLFGILLLATQFLLAQTEYQFGILPAINLSKSLQNDYKINLKIESRQELNAGSFTNPSRGNYNYILTDFQTVLAKKIGFNQTLATGYLLRFRNGNTYHRTLQQFIINSSYSGLRVSHRIAADQTFAQIESPSFRLRYRLATEVALNGQKVDAKELYLKLNNEYLNALQSGTYDLEIRVLPFLGYVFTDTSKLEFGLDYRINSFVNGPASHRFWIGVNFYQSF